MRLGLFGRFPLRMGGGKPQAQAIYEAMRDGRGSTYSRDDSALANLELRAYARAMAIAASYQRRGAWQAHPGKATDLLREWERRLGVTPDPSDTLGDRRGALEGVLAGNGFPSYDNIVRALDLAIGETVAIVAGTAATRVAVNAALAVASPAATAGTDGALQPGDHTLRVAWELADGSYTVCQNTTTVTVAGGGALHVSPAPLGAVVGAVRCHYYLSVTRNSASLAWVATGDGGAIVLGNYPRNPGTPGLHHLGIVVAAATAASSNKRAKIHKVLGPMLPAHVTYSIVTESPFILGPSSPPGSPLTLGAF